MLNTKVVIAKPARPRGPGSAGVQPTRSNALRVGSASGCRPIRSRVEMVALSMGSPSPNPASPGGHPPGFGLIELSNEPTAHTRLFQTRRSRDSGHFCDRRIHSWRGPDEEETAAKASRHADRKDRPARACRAAEKPRGG